MKRYEFYTNKELAEKLTPNSCDDCVAHSICQRAGYTCTSAKRAWAFGDVETKPRLFTFESQAEMELAWTEYPAVVGFWDWLWEEVEVEVEKK